MVPAVYALEYKTYMPKKILVVFPPGMLEQIDQTAAREHRNRSDLIREAVRRYLDSSRRTQGTMPLDGNASSFT